MGQDVLCPVHNQAFKWVAPGVSKKTGKPYQGFWSCPEMGCRMKPNEPVNQYQPVSQPNPNTPYQKSGSKMSEEGWQKFHAQKSKDILLQVAFKAAIEVEIGLEKAMIEGKTGIPQQPFNVRVFENTLKYHTWLLAQTQPQKPNYNAGVTSTGETVTPDQAVAKVRSMFNPADVVAEANAAFDDAMQDVDGSEIGF
jgi:hypothetical protein